MARLKPGRRSLFLLLLVAVACGPKRDESPAPGPKPPPPARTCPVCAVEIPPDRGVVVREDGSEAIVCSQGCAIRYGVSKLPPASRPETRDSADEPGSDEER